MEACIASVPTPLLNPGTVLQFESGEYMADRTHDTRTAAGGYMVPRPKTVWAQQRAAGAGGCGKEAWMHV